MTGPAIGRGPETGASATVSPSTDASTTASPSTASPATVGVLVMAHGTPPSLDGLESFYTEIRRGSPPPAPLLADLRRRYEAIGGVSPLTERTRAQVAGLAAALEREAPGRFAPAYGAKFADPRIEAAVDELLGHGATRLVGLVLAPHSSTVSVGEYARRARAAVAAADADAGLGRAGVELTVVDHWYDAPGFTELLADRVTGAVDSLPAAARSGAVVLFTAHSVPRRVIEAGDPYAEQVAASAAAVAAAAPVGRWEVAWQSAGRTADPWLGPDILDVIRDLPARGATACVVCPIGFVSDHLEVLYDIDIEARQVAEAAGLPFARTASLNDDGRFCEVLAGVILSAAGDDRAAAGRTGTS